MQSMIMREGETFEEVRIELVGVFEGAEVGGMFEHAEKGIGN